MTDSVALPSCQMNTQHHPVHGQHGRMHCVLASAVDAHGVPAARTHGCMNTHTHADAPACSQHADNCDCMPQRHRHRDKQHADNAA